MRKWILRLLFLVFFCMTATSTYFIFSIKSQYTRSQKAIEDLKENEKISSNPKNLINLVKKLHEKNADCVGWVSIEGTNIDYPVMYHPSEEEYYLKRNFQKDYDICGLPYISENCNLDVSDNLIVYGHHMKDGSMFADLDNYKEKAYFNEHQIIQLVTTEEVRTYQIVCVFSESVYTDSTFEYYSFTQAQNITEFEQYMTQCKKYQLFDTSEVAQYGDRLITLSTCEYTQKNGRIVVVGKQIY